VASILPKVRHEQTIEKELHTHCLFAAGERSWFSLCSSLFLKRQRNQCIEHPSIVRIGIVQSQNGSPIQVVGVNHRPAEEKSIIPKEAAIGFSKRRTQVLF
jgi:hypothetical protein